MNGASFPGSPGGDPEADDGPRAGPGRGRWARPRGKTGVVTMTTLAGKSVLARPDASILRSLDILGGKRAEEDNGSGRASNRCRLVKRGSLEELGWD